MENKEGQDDKARQALAEIFGLDPTVVAGGIVVKMGWMSGCERGGTAGCLASLITIWAAHAERRSEIRGKRKEKKDARQAANKKQKRNGEFEALHNPILGTVAYHAHIYILKYRCIYIAPTVCGCADILIALHDSRNSLN